MLRVCCVLAPRTPCMHARMCECMYACAHTRHPRAPAPHCSTTHARQPAQVKAAVEAGSLSSADLDRALNRTLAMRFATGQFDPPGSGPWAGLQVSEVRACVCVCVAVCGWQCVCACVRECGVGRHELPCACANRAKERQQN
jgi:hypothetical protein